MRQANRTPRRATRSMYVAFISTNRNAILFDLSIKHFPFPFYIAVSRDDPAIKEFVEADGGIAKLLELQGTEVKFIFENFISNEWLVFADLVRIEKKKCTI
jgi:hypothetical protein